MIPRAPDFICIGAQKAATSWLYQALRHQREVYVPPIKELHYFSELYLDGVRRFGPGHRGKQAAGVRKYLASLSTLTPRQTGMLACLDGIETEPLNDDWYKTIFSFAGETQTAGDICPAYMILPDEAIAHVLSLNPAIKILLIVRDPVSRIWSQIRMHKRSRSFSGNLQEFRDGTTSLKPYKRRTDYAQYIPRWRAAVPTESFMMMTHDEVKASGHSALEKICRFIGVQNMSPRAVDNDPVHVGEAMAFPPEFRAFLLDELMAQYDFLADIFPQETKTWLAKHRAKIDQAV